MKHWYAVQAKPRQEGVAEQQLQNQGYVTYLPKVRVKKRRRDKWATVVEPLFPRYLFIQVDPGEQTLAPVRSTVGVAGLVRFGHLLRPVPDGVIRYLQDAEDPEFQQHRDDDWPHRKGDTLEILEGPFAGLKAIYQMPGAEERALLLITLLGRQTQVELPMNALSESQ